MSHQEEVSHMRQYTNVHGRGQTNEYFVMEIEPLCPSPTKGTLLLSPGLKLIITHIFWDTFTSHGDKPSCIEETTYNLCFGDPLCRRLQKLVGNDKGLKPGVLRGGGDNSSLFMLIDGRHRGYHQQSRRR